MRTLPTPRRNWTPPAEHSVYIGPPLHAIPTHAEPARRFPPGAASDHGGAFRYNDLLFSEKAGTTRLRRDVHPAFAGVSTALSVPLEHGAPGQLIIYLWEHPGVYRTDEIIRVFPQLSHSGRLATHANSYPHLIGRATRTRGRWRSFYWHLAHDPLCRPIAERRVEEETDA